MTEREKRLAEIRRNPSSAVDEDVEWLCEQISAAEREIAELMKVRSLETVDGVTKLIEERDIALSALTARAVEKDQAWEEVNDLRQQNEKLRELLHSAACSEHHSDHGGDFQYCYQARCVVYREALK